MRQDLIDRLREITPEEQELLNGSGEIRRERYTNRKDFVVDSRLLLNQIADLSAIACQVYRLQ